MRYVLGMAWREYRIRLTNPVLPLWDVLVPVVYLVVFGASLERWIGGALPASGSGAAAGTDYVTFFLGGVLGMVTFSIAMNSSYAFFEDLQAGMFHELLTYPFPRRDLLLGKLLFNALFSIVGGGLCLLAAVAVLGVRIKFSALLPLLAWTLVGTAGWYFLLSWLSLRMRGFNAYHTMTSGLYLLLMFISNLFYPVERLPAPANWAAWLNPVTWQVDLMREAIYGGGDPALLRIEAVGFVLFTLASYALANRSLNGSIE